MTWDHERVEELLAGHAVGGLDAEEAALAERALVEHVPGCERCRRAYEGYRLVAGDLALAAQPASPPDTLLVRLRRDVRTPRRRVVRPAWAIGAVAAVALLGMSGWNLWLTTRLDDEFSQARQRQGWLVDAVSTLSHPSSEVLSLRGGGAERVVVLYVPGEKHMYVMASQLPDPRFAYHVWFLGGDQSWDAGVLDTFHGWGMMPVRTDPNRWDLVMLTDEPVGNRPAPSASPVVSATVETA